MSTGIDLFNKKMAVNLGATLDPYGLNEDKIRVNKFHFDTDGGLFRITSANLNTGYSFSSDTFKKNKDKKEKTEDEEEDPFSFYENATGGGRADDLFGDTIGRGNQDYSQELRRVRRKVIE